MAGGSRPTASASPATSVSVDVNSIPLAAIERVEVLKDGASAIYGSDAIAGVINFILRQEFKGVELTGEYGDTTHGGANLKRGHGHLRLRRSRERSASTSWWSAPTRRKARCSAAIVASPARHTTSPPPTTRRRATPSRATSFRPTARAERRTLPRPTAPAPFSFKTRCSRPTAAATTRRRR
jgi:outer membrane receptor protein involved in Fe transport